MVTGQEFMLPSCSDAGLFARQIRDTSNPSTEQHAQMGLRPYKVLEATLKGGRNAGVSGGSTHIMNEPAYMFVRVA